MNDRLPPRLRLDAPILLSTGLGQDESRKNRHFLCGSQGQSLTELALVLPLLVVLLIGAVEIGRAAYYSIAVTNAARSAVQYGAQNTVTAAQTDLIKQAALDDAPMLSPDNVILPDGGKYDKGIFYECPDGSAASNPPTPTDCSAFEGRSVPYLEVNTQMALTPLIGFPGLPTSFSLQGKAIMRIGNN